MMMKSKSPLLECEKQTQPLPGEVSPEEARSKAMLFAVQEKRQRRNNSVSK